MGKEHPRTGYRHHMSNKLAEIFETSEIGIARPSGYSVFKHGNCVGCLKAGQQHWYIVYCTRPDIWLKAKWAEEEIGYSIIHTEDGPLYLEDLEPKFEEMRLAGVPATELIPQQTFWAQARKFIKIYQQDQLPCECGLAESEHTACDDGLGDSPRGDFEFDCVIDDHCHEFDGVSVERGRDYRYFNPCAENYTGIDDAEIRKCCLQDFERMQDLDRGEWCFVGVRADAQILIPNGSQGSSTIQTITSGGLWGIESDSGEYFKEVEKEQLDELRDQLHALGFSKRAISAAFRNVEHKDA